MPRLELRPYQQECFERAKKQNTIVNLDTGFGKTLIAARLVEHFLDTNPTKRIAFLVPTRPLVEQQAEYIAKHCRVAGHPPVVQKLVGQNQTSWNQSDWDSCMRTSHVILGTAAWFQQGFVTDRFFRVEHFSLIVFDECHNATGNSPMAAVMHDAVAPFLNANGSSCPRILGLTASFVNGNLRNMNKKRRDLEALLQSTIFCPKVKEKLANDKFIYVPWKRDEAADRHKQAIQRHVERAIAHMPPLKDATKLINRCAHVFEQLGTCSLFYYVDKVVIQQLNDKAHSMKDIDDRSLKCACRILAGLDGLRAELKRLRCALGADPFALEAAPRSFKVAKLVELLKQVFKARDPSQHRGIVFCEQVALVSSLAKLLNDALSDIGLRCGAVAGSGYQSEKDRQSHLDSFKNGRIQILVATAALEEGIDVPECAFVVRYSSVPTTKAHIQGAGRARHPDATIYYFDNDPVEERRKETSMKETAGNSALGLSMKELQDAAESMSSTIDLRHPFPFPSLGGPPPAEDGQVNVFNCKKIFNNFCSVMLGTTIRPKNDLYKYRNQPGERKILESIQFPTPDGWHAKSAEDYGEYWRGCDFEKLFSSERTRRKSAPEKEEMAFVYIVVVELRKQGLLNQHNQPVKIFQFDTKRSCSLAAEWCDTIHVKNAIFQSAM